MFSGRASSSSAALTVAALVPLLFCVVRADSGFWFNQFQANTGQTTIDCITAAGDDWGFVRIVTDTGVCSNCISFAGRLWDSPSIRHVEYEVWVINQSGESPTSRVDAAVAAIDAAGLPRTKLWLLVNNDGAPSWGCTSGTNCAGTQATNAAALLAGLQRAVNHHGMEAGVASSPNNWNIVMGAEDTGQFSSYDYAWIAWGTESYTGYVAQSSWPSSAGTIRQWNADASGLCSTDYYRGYRDATPPIPHSPWCPTTNAYSAQYTGCGHTHVGRVGNNAKGIARCYGETAADIAALNSVGTSEITDPAITWTIDECPPPPSDEGETEGETIDEDDATLDESADSGNNNTTGSTDSVIFQDNSPFTPIVVATVVGAVLCTVGVISVAAAMQPLPEGEKEEDQSGWRATVRAWAAPTKQTAPVGLGAAPPPLLNRGGGGGGSVKKQAVDPRGPAPSPPKRPHSPTKRTGGSPKRARPPGPGSKSGSPTKAHPAHAGYNVDTMEFSMGISAAPAPAKKKNSDGSKKSRSSGKGGKGGSRRKGGSKRKGPRPM